MSLRSTARLGALLIVAAASGYLVGGCSGEGLEGLSGVTELPTVATPDVTVPEVTVPTIPDVTVPTLPDVERDTTNEAPTEPATTTEVETTTEAETTTVVETATETETETETETQTETVTATVPTDTAVAVPTLVETTPADTSSDDDNLWAWVALTVALLGGAGALAYYLWKRQRGEGDGESGE